METYWLRKLIRQWPGYIMEMITKPEPAVIEGFHSRIKVGEICKNAGFKKVLLVTDATLYGLQYHSAITDSLQKEQIQYQVFHDIQTEPSIAVVKSGRDAALQCQAECIIALGGGSVMDSCKVIAAGAQRKRRSVSSLLRKFLFVKTLPVIAIPSTAGTGAETTIAAIVKNSKGVKNPTVFIHLNISNVILDSELTVKMPGSITAACGIDALSHGLEGLLSTIRYNASDYEKSSECVRLVLQNIPLLLDNPENVEARQSMCRAAFYGGNAINKQLAGYVHAFAHSIGAKYHIAHGNAIAISLMPVMRFQKKRCLKPLATAAVYCGLANETADLEYAADKLLDTIAELIEKCNLPTHIAIPDTDVKELTQMIEADSISYTPPVIMKCLEIKQILEEINR